MSVDLSRFHATFFAESFEQLDAMEAVLLRSDLDIADAEAVNTLFRAAHSVKGGSATFGFTDIADVTHHLETLLDEVRGGSRQLTPELVDLILAAVDALRTALTAHKEDRPGDPARLADLGARLGEIADSTPQGSSQTANEQRWIIAFTPHAHMMARGNDPYRLIRELAQIAPLSCEAFTDGIPDFDEFDPEQCYLRWRITLEKAVDRAAVDEVFEWVEADCDLDITAPDQAHTNAKAEATAPAAQPTPTSVAGHDQILRDSVRVDIDKIDQLVDMVGELVITQSRLDAILDAAGEREQHSSLGRTLAQMHRNIRSLQEASLQMRMVPISFAFNRLPRLIHDLNRSLGKQARLIMRGADTEVDKGLLESIQDPLLHLLRNALDHGIESNEKRAAAGKPVESTLRVAAYHRGGNVLVEVSDDGRGLNLDAIRKRGLERGLLKEGDPVSDDQLRNLIFSPGFSTAEEVTDVSGRGVGLDVVRRNIQELGGQVSVESEPGKGALFRITVPLTLSIIEGQLVRIGQSEFVIPLLSIIESGRLDPSKFEVVGGHRQFFRFRGDVIPTLDLAAAWDLDGAPEDLSKRMLVVVEWADNRTALIVEELLSQQQVVVKSLEANFRRVSGLSGATILGTGDIALIIDVASLGALGPDRRKRPRTATEGPPNA